ncbi:electron transporter [Pseudozyma hubeiensis SY62]|uniref:Electron transporter n=1 Tax=Pseudozyma hubeiensis (strain SY62) TaxID=1305764 RepID=R9NX53_PSEHS|nr:electron transporter [Pseudozyma hubeiensis SY62]GAC93159.1 electron transporter [Pseudozyma hubeiensis SY62]
MHHGVCCTSHAARFRRNGTANQQRFSISARALPKHKEDAWLSLLSVNAILDAQPASHSPDGDLAANESCASTAMCFAFHPSSPAACVVEEAASKPTTSGASVRLIMHVRLSKFALSATPRFLKERMPSLPLFR